MKIAILSDSHDYHANIDKVCPVVNEMADVVLFCGDVCAPGILRRMVSQIQKPIHMVFGNNDGDRFNMTNVRKDYPHIVMHGEYAVLELDGKRIGMTHYPFYGDVMAKSRDFDIVAFGHDHEPRILTYENCLAINPGSICGDKKPASFALYDSVNHMASLHNLDGSVLVE